MANKYLRPRYSTLKIDKLDKLAKKLQTSFGSSDFFTQEQYLAEAVKVLTTFYKTLSEPVFDEVVRPRRGSLPNADLYNKTFEDIKDNLDVIFAEFENIEDFVLANFNYAVTGANRLNARLKKVSSLVGDYILYTENGSDLILFRDSFDNSNKLTLGSSLLNTDECSLNQSEGIITLPVDATRDSSVAIYRSPTVQQETGAAYGNNYEIGADWHGDITTIIDNNADTWFEYERVVRAEDDTGKPLTLDVMLQLNKPGIVNFIRVNPNNFGTRTSVGIERIETSLDGKDFINIKDDIPIAGYLTEDEANIFTLAPSTSKYAGQGLYTFTPRKAKYIHFVFTQSDPYIIDTTSGERLRYAIGLRDIEIKAIPYLAEGEIISASYQTSREISKISMRSSQNPIEKSQLASIEHFISVDNGISWHQIQPQQEEGEAGVIGSVPEILNFNNADANSITTAQPVTSVIWKAALKRDDSAFTEDGGALYKNTVFTSEIHSVPYTSPHSITLNSTPLEGTIQVVDPLFGSRGIPSLEYRVSNSSTENEYFLPETWEGIDAPLKKVVLSGLLYDTVRSNATDWMKIYVENKEWAPKTLGDSLSDFTDYDIEDEVYALDWDNKVLYFGDGHTYGKNPGGNRVALRFEAERLAPIDGAETPAPLVFQSGPDKDLVKIKRYGTIKNGTTAVPKGATILRLKHKNIVDVLTTIPGTEKPFANGKDEFSSTGQWSINKTAGIIYLSSPVGNLPAITYTYQPIYTLLEDEWEWADKGATRDSVKINEDAWETIEYTYELDPLPVILSGYENIIHLPHQSIVKKTLAVTASGVDEPFIEEVPFIDGLEELTAIIQTTEDIPTLDTTPITTFSLAEDIVSDTNYGVTFDETARDYFTTEKSSPVEAGDEAGTYYINRTDNEVGVRISSAIDAPGKISYFYNKPDIRSGLYSVDYVDGRIFTQEAVDSLDSLIIEYEYTDYRIEYPIARLVASSDYEVDYASKILKFTSAEVLNDFRVSKTLSSRYEVSYDYVSESREDVAALKDYFTPVLKDYVLKLMPKE